MEVLAGDLTELLIEWTDCHLSSAYIEDLTKASKTIAGQAWSMTFIQAAGRFTLPIWQRSEERWHLQNFILFNH